MLSVVGCSMQKVSTEASPCAADPRRTRQALLITHETPLWASDALQALWMDGLVSIGAAVSEQERAELMDLMQDREVHVRTDTYEMLLATIAEQDLV